MTVLTLDSGLDTPLSGGTTGVAPSVPDLFEVAINGRAYRIDHNAPAGATFTRRSINVQRTQADTSASPGEQTLNRETDWRRVVESWHHGAGQTYFDRQDSDPYRFARSKGVCVWDKWALSLLNDTTQIRASANTNLRLTTAGSYTYLIDGNDLLYTTDVTAGPVVWTTVTGTPGSAATWIASDGFTVYVGYGTAIYSTTRGGATASSFSTGFASTVTVLGYVKGRLMAAAANALHNITASGAIGAALLTHPNTDFTWVGFAEGPGNVYAAGYSGNRSLIYKTAIQPDGTALSIPTVAGELPTGEIVRTIKGYLGVLLIGTDLGMRLAVLNSDGSLSIGSLIPTTSPVLNFEPADRFVWYGLSNFDSSSTGLGRVDLTAFTAAVTPSYASDLMAATQGAVLSISTQGTRRVFTVSGAGVYAEAANKVASGWVTSGRITYGIGDEKVAMYLDLRHAALTGTVAVSLASDDSAAVPIGGSTEVGTTRPDFPLSAGQTRGEFFETTITLNRAVATPTLGPTVNRYTLRGYPSPRRTFQFTVPILLWTKQRDLNDSPVTYEPLTERQLFEALVKSSQLVAYQEGNASYTVLVEDVVWLPRKQTPDRNTYDGTCVVFLKEQTA